MAIESEATASLRLYLLGHFRAKNGQEPIHLPTRKMELLLAYLVLHPQPHTRDKLAALGWGDFTDTQARASLRNALATLRRQFGNDLLLAGRETVQLNSLYPLWVDTLEFHAQATAFLAHALPNPAGFNPELYGGDLLADFDEDWLLPEREHYRLLYQDALLQLVQQLRSQGDYARAISLAERLLAGEPAHEPAHQQIIACYLALDDRHKALKQAETCLRLLRDELDVEPQPETIALYQRTKHAPPPASRTFWSNLPNPLTSFIGRERELAEIAHLLRLPATRLLTLAGPGGCGKTRLALRVAHELGGAFTEGAWWVDLAMVTDPPFVPQAVAKALGLREIPGQPVQETLIHQLHPKQLLLLLDNCEHLIVACAQLAQGLLQACPRLQILATSREALGLIGERLWPVSSLSVPDLHPPGAIADLRQSEAVQLFLERAVATRPDFKLTVQNGPAIAQICRRLDGIPLAIELAAARVKILPPEQIAARLDDRFTLLASSSRVALPRQQTLRATMDWSYDLLEAEEQILFRRLSVFAGSFTLDAVEAICKLEQNDGEAEQVSSPSYRSATFPLHLLSRLVDKSLVGVEIAEDGQVRYRLLETIRQYGLDRLWLSSEERRLRNRHLSWFTQLAQQAEPALLGPQQIAWLDQLEQDYANLSIALQWSIEAGPAVVEAGLRLSGALWRFWDLRGHIAEGREQLRQLLCLPGAEDQVEARAKALFSAGMLALYQMDSESAVTLLEESLALWQKLAHKPGRALVLQHLGFIAHRLGQAQLARSRYEESLALWRELAVPWGLAEILGMLGNLAYWEKDYETARVLQAESLSIKRQLGEKRGLAFSLWSLGKIACAQSDYPVARSLYEEALTTMRQLEDKGGIPFVLEAFGYLAVAEGQLPRAARLLGAAESLREATGSVLPAVSQADHERDVSQVRSQLGAPAFTAAWTEGRAMTLDQAVDYALQIG